MPCEIFDQENHAFNALLQASNQKSNQTDSKTSYMSGKNSPYQVEIASTFSTKKGGGGNEPQHLVRSKVHTNHNRAVFFHLNNIKYQVH